MNPLWTFAALMTVLSVVGCINFLEEKPKAPPPQSFPLYQDISNSETVDQDKIFLGCITKNFKGCYRE